MVSRRAPDFGALLARVGGALERHGLSFMVIGGQAVLLHGEPRLTRDVDLTVGIAPDRIGDLLAVCGEAGLEPVPGEPDAFARRTFVLPALDPGTRVRVDFVFSTTPYEAEAIGRAERVAVGGGRVPFATAEDLIIHKLFAARPRDIEDAAGVVRRKGHHLDWEYLRRWCAEFAKVEGREGMPASLAALRRELEP